MQWSATLNQKNWHTEALQIFRQEYGDQHHYTARSYNALGLLYQKMGQQTKSLNHLLKALEIREMVDREMYSDIEDSLQNLALLYSSMGKHDTCAEYWEKLLLIAKLKYGFKHPYTLEVFNNRCLVFVDQKEQKEKFLECIKEYKEEQMIAEYAGGVFGIIRVAANLFKKKQIENTIFAFELIEFLSSKIPAVHIARAEMFYQLNKLDDAIYAYGKAIKCISKIAPTDLKSSTLPLETIGDCQEAIKAHPDDPLKHKNLGDAYYRAKNYEEAIQAYDNALGLDPSKPLSYHAKAQVLIEQGRFLEAVGVLKQALDKDPKLGETYYLLGYTLKEQGELIEAISVMRRGLMLSSLFELVVRHIGIFGETLMKFCQQLKLDHHEC